MDKIVNDAVYGIITLKPYIIPIIDTLEFQRLRWIWQLGTAPFVYPTANHSRFEHCIGTYHLASRLIMKIQKQLEIENQDLRISNEEIKCVEIAALCHDIGHGPFSHLWDNRIVQEICNNPVPHEQQFGEMWSIMKENNYKLKCMLKEENLENDGEQLIERLVLGKPNENDKIILFYIVSNPDSGFDVDKWDYIARDTIQLGQSSTNFRINIDRLIHFARAVKDKKSNQWKIAYRDKETTIVMNVYQMRFDLYKTAYQHLKVINMDELLVDGIKKCVEQKLLNSCDLNNPKWILKQTDSIFWELQNKHDIEEFRRILQRDLYHLKFQAMKKEIIYNQKIIINDLRKMINSNNIRFIITKSKLGNKPGNPINLIPFYKKYNLNECFYYDNNNMSRNMELNFDETRFYVFSTKRDEIENIDNIIAKIRDWAIENQWIIV